MKPRTFYRSRIATPDGNVDFAKCIALLAW